MLVFTKDHYAEIEAHGEETFPSECCGAIVGVRDGEKKIVRSLHKLTNTNTERAKDRYEVDGKELNKIAMNAMHNKEDILGFYHSHPDHPNEPSQFDRDRAWPYYSYIIISIMGGKAKEAKNWTFEEDDEPFKEEKFEVI